MQVKDTTPNLRRVVGIKQTTKAISNGLAVEVLIARDAEERVAAPLRELCREAGIVPDETMDMLALGRACSIEVGAAAAALVRI